MATKHQDGCGRTEISDLQLPLPNDESNTQPADSSQSSMQRCVRQFDPSSPGESELSLTDDVSGMEKACLIQPQTTKTTLPLEMQSRESPVEPMLEVQKSPSRKDNNDAQPVCSQLSVSYLKASPGTSCTVQDFHHYSKTHPSSSSLSKKTFELQQSGDDLCASFVLACLFCRLEECFVAVGDACEFCLSSMCSSVCSKVCCCSPASLEPFLEVCPSCDLAACLEAHCLCSAADFSICDLCIHATECLELGMEVSQLLFH